jgi:hypothetical protein
MRTFSLLRAFSQFVTDRLITLAGPIAVGPPVLSGFGISQQPGPTTSGVAHPVQPILVTADQYGNPIVAAITITAAIQSGSGTISAGASKATTGAAAAFTNLTPDVPSTQALVYRFTSPSLPGFFVDSDPVVVTKPVIVVPPDPDEEAPPPPDDDVVVDPGTDPGMPIDQVSEVSISNLALAHLGNTDGIASLDEASTAARACKQVYALARDEVLRAFPWPFATSDDALALVATYSRRAWSYGYRYPSDALAVWGVLPEAGAITNTRETTVAYKIGKDATGQLIYTAQPDAYARITYRLTDPMLFPPEFVLALSFFIAYLIAPQVTGGDPNKLGLRAYESYLLEIEKAKVLALNQTADPDAGESEFIRARS